MSALRAEYEQGSKLFLSQIDWLAGQGFTAFRRAKGMLDSRRLRHTVLVSGGKAHSVQAMATVFTDVRLIMLLVVFEA